MVALLHLVRQVEAWGFRFVDCQVHTPLLAAMGAVEVPRQTFTAMLHRALQGETRRGLWHLEIDPPTR